MVAAVDTRATGGAAVSGGRGGVDVAGDDAFAELAATVRRQGREIADLRELVRRALAVADAAAAAADRAVKARLQRRTEAARIAAARLHITNQVKRYAADRNLKWLDVFAALRLKVGLRRVKDGGAPLKGLVRADQILLLARAAHELGVAETDNATVTAILEGA
jgi:hypothetical protein